MLLGKGVATITALIVLHLVAAAVMIPALARSLRAATVDTALVSADVDL
ncbi:hypothetical protein GCM10023350_17520 [Nocardioides endophyticus]|uniref:ABC transporter permease n=1 Tax=Nocardioides endophyticus TaxID=1353775 RepID=A0ABP8YP74_9ACTN